MRVLSIDLAYRRHADIGLALLDGHDTPATASFPTLALKGTPEPGHLADHIAGLAGDLGAGLLLIDGPQGWKSPDNGLIHSRLCERLLNTPAKSGLPGDVKPANYAPFVAFSIAFFDRLEQRGWPRLRDPGRTSGVAVESFPFAAWRSLGLPPLPAKTKTTAAALREHLDALLAVFPTRLQSMPNHDQLQALVTGYAGLAIAAAHRQGVELVGQAPFTLEGHIREGFIACPLRPVPASGLHATAAITEIPPEQVPLALLLLADPSESKVRGYLPGARCFAALRGGQVVGVCAVVTLAPGVHELMNLAVDPAMQRHGIGARLLRHVLETYRREGARRLELGTGTFGYQLAFYQRHGFRVFQVDRGFFLRNYAGPLMEDGIQHKDMLRLAIDYPAAA